jgi:hypothetical protein
MSTKIVDLNVVRDAWISRYGFSKAKAMMGSAWPVKTGMAHDSMPPKSFSRARDQDPPDDSSGGAFAACKTFFCKIASVRKIFPAFSSFQQCSSGGEQQAVEPVDEGEFASVEGKDDPSSFPGMPKKNDKGYAGDAAQPRRNGHGYFDAFPSNRKVGFGYGD